MDTKLSSSSAGVAVRALVDELALSFSHYAEGFNGNGDGDSDGDSDGDGDDWDDSRFPLSPLGLYRIGLVLFECSFDGGDDEHRRKRATTRDIFDRVVGSTAATSPRRLSAAVRGVRRGYSLLVDAICVGCSADDGGEYSDGDLIEGTKSLCGMYLSSNTLCRSLTTGGSSEKNDVVDLLASLAAVYEHSVTNAADTSRVVLSAAVLRAMSRLLVHGLILPPSRGGDGAEDVRLERIMDAVRRFQSTVGESNRAMGDMLEQEKAEEADASAESSFMGALQSVFKDHGDEMGYLIGMLNSFPRTIPSAGSDSGPTYATSDELNQGESLAPQQDLDRTSLMIQQIRDVLPSLGEGFCEEALRCYQYDLELTLSALIEGGEESSTLHPRLHGLDKKLPRQKREMPGKYEASVDLAKSRKTKDGEESKETQKAALKEMERRGEEEAYVIDVMARGGGGGFAFGEEGGDEDDHNDVAIATSHPRDVYNDDYDDQYDGIGDDGGGGIGGLDDGLYDTVVDQDTMRKYNRLVMNVENESKFWSENRNSNRDGQGGNSKDGNGNEQDEGQERKYRGADKGRGGRLIGPDGKYLPIKRGGKKGGNGNGGNAGRGGGEHNQQQEGGGGGRGKGGRKKEGGSTGNGGKSGGGGSGSAQQQQKGGDNVGNDGDNLSKIQKRRKNDNKAKVGNHHRKDRATKKTSGGMMS